MLVMDNWNKRKFVVAPQFFDETPSTIVLSDIAYWNEHYEELKDWCDFNNCEVVGMTVEVPRPEIVTLFVLRWS